MLSIEYLHAHPLGGPLDLIRKAHHDSTIRKNRQDLFRGYVVSFNVRLWVRWFNRFYYSHESKKLHWR